MWTAGDTFRFKSLSGLNIIFYRADTLTWGLMEKMFFFFGKVLVLVTTVTHSTPLSTHFS